MLYTRNHCNIVMYNKKKKEEERKGILKGTLGLMEGTQERTKLERSSDFIKEGVF